MHGLGIRIIIVNNMEELKKIIKLSKLSSEEKELVYTAIECAYKMGRIDEARSREELPF